MNQRLPLLLLLLLCLVGGSLAAQQPLRGRIIDAETREPLPGALAIWAGATNGAVADSTGRFSLPLREGAVLHVRSLGYKELSQRIAKGEKGEIVFALTPDPLTLPTTTILSDGLQRVHPDPFATICDYEFLDGNILLLTYDRLRKRNILQLFDPEINLLAEYDDPKHPMKSLIHDCLGNRHCMGTEEVGQLDFARGHLFLRWDSLAAFNRVVGPCIAHLDSMYYFASVPHDYARAFFCAKEGSPKRYYLYGTIDEAAKKLIFDEGESVRREGVMTEVSITQSYVGRPEMRQIFQASLNRQFLFGVLAPPIYVPLVVADESINIFDHPHDRIMRYNRLGGPLDTVQVSYNHLPNWRKEVIADETREHVYTFTERNGIYTLHEVDLNMGELGQSWELQHPFPVKVMIMGGWIYYTHRDNADSGIKRLYRQSME